MNVAINILVHFSLFLQCFKSGIKCDKLFTPFCLCQLLAIRLLWSIYNGKLHKYLPWYCIFTIVKHRIKDNMVFLPWLYVTR